VCPWPPFPQARMHNPTVRKRESARLLVVDTLKRTLLFHFVHQRGALAGRTYWATPGGGVENGETFEQAACRELREETGIVRSEVGSQVAERTFQMQLPDGEYVIADERYFLVAVADANISKARWTVMENEVVTDFRWWIPDELAATSEIIYPEDLTSILAACRIS
jgi:8-oxo-dGTP pyrophosphatase MutT (NUDIX family)